MNNEDDGGGPVIVRWLTIPGTGGWQRHGDNGIL
jgi:hypothetical protein